MCLEEIEPGGPRTDSDPEKGCTTPSLLLTYLIIEDVKHGRNLNLNTYSRQR